MKKFMNFKANDKMINHTIFWGKCLEYYNNFITSSLRCMCNSIVS